MRALDPEVFDAVYAAVEPILPQRTITIRSAVTAVGPRTGRVCGRSSSASSPGAPGWMRRPWSADCLGHHAAGPGATSGKKQGSFRTWSKRPWPPTTRSSASISPMWLWTAPSTRHPGAAREPAPTPLTGENAGGSGHCSRTRRGSRSAGRPPVLTATTRSCSAPPWKRSPLGGCTWTSKSSTSIGAMTMAPSDRCVAPMASATSWLPNAGPTRNPASAERSRQCPWALRWPVERTNSWLVNFGQLRRGGEGPFGRGPFGGGE